MPSQSGLLFTEPVTKSSASLRGERTRRRIAEATLSLLEESPAPPTSRDIAERAGVSLRLIFHHFEDLDALHDTVGTLYADLFGKFTLHVPDHLPLDARVERTVKLRAKLYESIGNLGRNVTVLAPHNPGMAARLASTQEMMIRSLESTFAPEVRDAGMRHRELLAALDIATAWPTWDRLRTVNRLSVASSRRVTSQMLHCTLRSASPREGQAVVHRLSH
ncbi:MAG TPA: TetR/AcrR family transcriptional regulator [Acidimicrobiales bacterium]|nr:TetR/AcrR family transcriptional regulator [Acidimicrobiales bacterium]